MRILAASILSADFSKLGSEIKAIEDAGVDWIHVDVMDGHFVPNITIGPGVVKAIRKTTDLPFDVHLMIENPENYIDAFVDAGANWLSIHVEATKHLHRAIQKIKARGVKACIGLNPATPIEWAIPVLSEIDMILVMTVNPGFGGQEFISAVLSKIRRLRSLIDEMKVPVLLEADGGVNINTVDKLIDAGTDVFVAGTAVFRGCDYKASVRALKTRMNQT